MRGRARVPLVTRSVRRAREARGCAVRARCYLCPTVVVAAALWLSISAGEIHAAGWRTAQPPSTAPAEERIERVTLENDGWRLVGDWQTPPGPGPLPAALLLHRAAGSRGEYVALAAALAQRGVASLRLDLRACGESVNRGRFVEPFAQNRPLLDGTYRDVDAGLSWIKSRADVDAARVAVVGASYSGEAVAEGLRRGGEKAAAYVMLSPGSFSDESIAEVDRSDAAWLFVRTREESEVSRPFIDAVFEALAEGSASAQVLVLPGEGHATRIFDHHPLLIHEIADWIADRLEGDAEPSRPPSSPTHGR